MADPFPAAGELAALTASGRPFAPGECAALAMRAADLLRTDVLSRAGAAASFVLWHDEHSLAWLNVTPEWRDTGYHDHDGSAIGVYVIKGSVTNEGLPVGGPRRVHRYGPGDRFSFVGSGIHRMDHDAGSVTIHVYSPPLRAIGYYEVVDGLLQRTLGPPDEASPESPRLLAALNGQPRGRQAIAPASGEMIPPRSHLVHDVIGKTVLAVTPDGSQLERLGAHGCRRTHREAGTDAT